MKRLFITAFILAIWAGLPSTLVADEASTEGAVLHRTAECGCCHLWGDAMAEEGIHFEHHIVEYEEMDEIKYGWDLEIEHFACHSAEIGGYLVEGHVPAFAIERLMSEKPDGAKGLVVPGMPTGSPGMGGPEVDYEIYLLREDNSLEPWLRARGGSEISKGPEPN